MAGAPDSIKGEVPVCFCVPAPGCAIDAEVQAELQSLAITSIGTPLAAPAWFAQVASLPQTRTGKYLRRLLRDIVNSPEHSSESGSHSSDIASSKIEAVSTQQICDRLPADHGALCNPESLEEARVVTSESSI